MLQPPGSFNPTMPMPFNSQMGGQPPIQPQQSSMMPQQQPIDGMMGNPQTESYAHGGAVYAHGGQPKKKRTSMCEVYMAPDEIKEMVEAQGGPEFDKMTGRHMFKKLSRSMENPHFMHAIKQRYAAGGSMGNPGESMNGIMGVLDQSRRLGMGRPGFAAGGHTDMMRSPMGEEKYGRGGDTELVYITPHMKRIFDESGKGTINPHNGRHEYFGLSDIWNGIKTAGSYGLQGLNAIAPQLASAVRPMTAMLPGGLSMLANKALDYAPGAINSLNEYVNHPSKSAQSPQDQERANAFGDMPFNGEESPEQPSWKQQLGNFAGDSLHGMAGQMGGGMGRAAQAGINSYRGGNSMPQTAANMFSAGTAGTQNPYTQIARQGANGISQGQNPMQYAPQMGLNAARQGIKSMMPSNMPASRPVPQPRFSMGGSTNSFYPTMMPGYGR